MPATRSCHCAPQSCCRLLASPMLEVSCECRKVQKCVHLLYYLCELRQIANKWGVIGVVVVLSQWPLTDNMRDTAWPLTHDMIHMISVRRCNRFPRAVNLGLISRNSIAGQTFCWTSVFSVANFAFFWHFCRRLKLITRFSNGEVASNARHVRGPSVHVFFPFGKVAAVFVGR
jgi:hypothetical protein